MVRKFVLFFLFISLLNGAIFPTYASLVLTLEKINLASPGSNLNITNLEDNPNCENAEEEIPDSIKEIKSYEDFILPYILPVYGGNSIKILFGLCVYGQFEHFLENISPPPKF